MAKGDDVVRRKRSKAQRMKLGRVSGVSIHVAAVIAAKRRRKGGRRRICEGMCFTLPTPEDPFNDTYGKKATKNTSIKNAHRQIEQKKVSTNTAIPQPGMVHTSSLQKSAGGDGHGLISSETFVFAEESQKPVSRGFAVQRGRFNDTDTLSKFIILCLNSIQTSWKHDGTFNVEKDQPLLGYTWGFDFWKECLNGSDIMETSGISGSREQFAWLVSTASDILTRKEKDGSFVPFPFLLILVSSQEQAVKVRSLCKPLKTLGIHTVSLHPGASVDHQVRGLKKCHPEFIISTPERLMELVVLGALDISCITLLVLSGMETFINGGTIDTLRVIREHVSTNVQTVIFGKYSNDVSTSVAQDLFTGPFFRL